MTRIRISRLARFSLEKSIAMRTKIMKECHENAHSSGTTLLPNCGTQNRQQQLPSAAERTFAIPELLEWILLHVAIHHADTSCACSEFMLLFPLQRISRRFYHTITGSRALLHLMLLKPINIRKERLLSASLGLLREKSSTRATWRKINVGLGDGNVPIRVRLRVILYPRGCTTTDLRRIIGPIVRYTIYWNIAETDTLGILFDRYLNVLSRTLEVHTAAGETYRLLRESKQYYKRSEAESAS